MANGYAGGLPGPRSERSAEARNILAVASSAVFLPGGVVLDGSAGRDVLNAGDEDVLRDGLLLGRISDSGKYAPSVLGELSEAYDKDGENSTVMTVPAATAAEIVRRIGSSGQITVAGPATEGGEVSAEAVTFTAVDVQTGEVTIEAAGHDFIAGSLVQPVDGSETPRCLLYAGGYGVKVTDAEGADIDAPLATPLIGGLIDADRILHYPADTALRAWLKTEQLKAVGAFVFDDDF